MSNRNQNLNYSLLLFLTFLFLISIPFLMIGTLDTSISKNLPMKLPLSAFMVICPSIVAIILIYHENSITSVKTLLINSLSLSAYKNTKYLIPTLFLMPVINFIAFLFFYSFNLQLLKNQLSPFSLCILFFFFFISAIFEEIGWMGYLYPLLIKKWNYLESSFIIGIIWALWHVIPYLQGNHSLYWAFWQCIFTIFIRIVMVKLFIKTGERVMTTILFHTTINWSVILISYDGSLYDPFFPALIVLIISSIIIINEIKHFNTKKTIDKVYFDN